MSKLRQYFAESSLYKKIIFKSKTVNLPGFTNLPIYTVAKFLYSEIKRESITIKASALAFNFLMAIFPAIIFLFTLIPYIPIDGFQEQLLSILMQILPQSAFLAFEGTITDILKNQNTGLLSVGFILAMLFSTNGIAYLMDSFNKASLVTENRSFIRKRIIAFALTIAILLITIIAVGTIVIGEFIINYLDTFDNVSDNIFKYILYVFKWLITGALFFIGISLLYYFGPARTKAWYIFSPGSILATILTVLTCVAFAFYINSFGAYNKIYGSIGTLIVVMLWLYFNSLVLLIGFELNASVELSKRSLLKPNDEIKI